MGLQSNVWPRRDNFLKHCNNISSKNPISVSQHPTTAFKKKNAGFPNRQDLIRFFDLDSDMLHVADRTATFHGQKRCHRRRLGSPSIRFNSMFPIFCVQRYGYDSKRLFVDVYMFIVATCIYDVQNKFDVHMSFAMSKQTAIDPARAPPQREGLLST